MKTFKQALKEGFQAVTDPDILSEVSKVSMGADTGKPSWHFDWEDNDNYYELWFEALLFNDQYYVALYKNQELMTEKVVVKPGKQ